MNLHSKEADEEVEIDMSPMIDMVFLLLIFFIVASKIIADKAPVEVPHAKAVIRAKERDENEVRYTISISKESEDEKHYYLPSSPKNMVTFDEMMESVIEAYDNFIDGKDPDSKKKFSLVVRGDIDVKFEDTEKVMAACAEAGIYNMIFSAMEED